MSAHDNLALLKRYYPDFEIIPPAAYPDILIKPARNGQKTMQFIAGERALYVHSAYDPAKEACGLADRLSLHYDSVLLVFGAGLMYHVKELAARAHPQCRIALIEPDYRAFMCAIYEAELNEVLVSGKVKFSIAQTEAELYDFLKPLVTRTTFMQTEIMALPAYTAKYPAEYAGFKRVAADLKTRRRVENTTTCNQSRLWERNIIKNMKHIPQSVRYWTFKDIFSGRPGVVVSSGPSLDKNVGLLKRLQDKALIISAHTSLNTLKKHGIKPDIAVAIDARQLIRETARRRKEPLDIPLLYIPTVDYRLLDKTSSEKIIAHTVDDRYIRSEYAKLGYTDGLFYPSGSVAVAATDFAATAGCDPVIFIGQDLAFTGRQVHSKAVGDSRGTVRDTLADTFMVEDVYGKKVPTNQVMELYRRTLEGYIRHDASKSGRRYIDATEGGARIAGTEVLPLADTLRRIRAGELAYGVKRLLKAHFADKANSTFPKHTAAAFLREIASIHSDIENNPDVRKLAGMTDFGEPGEAERLVERVSEFLYDRAADFNAECVYAENRFVQLYGAAYINHEFSGDAREAYMIKQAMTARILLERLSEFAEKTANISVELSEYY